MTTTAAREIQYREAINEAIRQEMERDESVIIMGEEIAGGAGREHLGIVDAWGGPFRTTVGLIQQFGNQRVLDTPLSEAAFVGCAIGASSTGMRAIAELMFVDFVGVCMDQLLNNAAKMRYMFGGQVKVPLHPADPNRRRFRQRRPAFRILLLHLQPHPRLEGRGPLRRLHRQGLAHRRHPRRTTRWSISSIRGCTATPARCQRSLTNSPWARPAPSGKAATSPWLAFPRMTWVCTAAADELAKEGVQAEVVDLLSVSPIDYDHVIESVRKTHRLVVVDEDTPICSLASEICARVAEEAFDYLDAPPSRVTAPHTPVPYSRPLENTYVPNEERVLKTVRTLLARG